MSAFDPAAFEAALLQLLNEEISLDPDSPIEMDTDLLLTGLVDSLGVVDVVAWIEDEYRIDIDPIDIVLENFQTPRATVAYLAGRLADSASTS